MRRTLIMSVSAISLFAASQQAFAIDKQAITSRPDLTVQQQMRPDVSLQQQKMNVPAAKELPKAGGMSGPGNLGGFGSAGDKGAAAIRSGTGIGKETGMGGIVPSGAMGKAQEGIGGLKGSRGQQQGVEAKESPSGKQAEGMRKSIGEAAASRGKEKGVGGQEGATAKQSEQMRKAIGEAAEGRGQEKGVEAQTGGGKLSKEQRQTMKDMTFDPKVNPSLASQDPKGDGKGGGGPKGDGKGGTAGSKPTPKPTGGTAGSKPTPKPTGGTTADKGKGGKGGGTAGGTGKIGGATPVNKEKEKKDAMKVFDFAKPKEVKPIVFPADKVYGKPPKGPKPEPKTDASAVATDGSVNN